MSIFKGFIKSKAPRGFNYTPLYYDEQKEQLQERIRAIELETGRRATALEAKGAEYTEDALRERISFSKVKSGKFAHQSRKTQIKKSNMRLLMILVFLLLAIAVFWTIANQYTAI